MLLIFEFSNLSDKLFINEIIKGLNLLHFNKLAYFNRVLRHEAEESTIFYKMFFQIDCQVIK